MSKLPARRGAELRNQILVAAKNAFLAAGFERTSMDHVATQAGTTKRTLYAHFGRKEDLFLAVFELVLGLQLHHLGQPADYAPDPPAALTQFCMRFLETILSSRPLSLFQLAIAETSRFPQGGTVRLHEALLESVEARITQFLTALGQPAPAARATQLLAQLLYPRFTRALFGAAEPAATHSDDLGDTPAVDPESVRRLVAAALADAAAP
ncbi:TetR/AcrR family transcriptional regulator [Hymenobacter sp. RP-2-7]|uniref:TetR/AcrR family transcriptional regulator n=1 Tax=Hymenobacter polaris TaxID=2682546 RepID=A0A7Y0FMS5_9BACT|nr:TetR/AcrR family transcriptional regulator [Hymenobacter polaris]NML65729.1 TetR/AcrR family transcriptional regulator [Hymenobacter polaris]